MPASLTEVNWRRYVEMFLDANTFADGLEAARAIARQSIADHGPGDTRPLEIQTIVEFNRRAAAEEKRARNEWLADMQSGQTCEAQRFQEFRDEVSMGIY